MKKIGSLILLFLATFVFGAQAHFNQESIIEGDRASLVLIAKGKDVEFPNLTEIDGFEVVSTNQSQSTQIINGDVKSSIQKEYFFYPSRDVHLPSLEFKVGGVVEKTEPITLHVKKLDKNSAPYSFSMKVSNDKPYENESVELEFEFRFKRDLHIVDLRFTPPALKNFWLKEGKKSQPVVDGEYVVQKLSYLLFPQQSGDLKLNPAALDVGLEDVRQDNFGFLSRGASYKRINSNEITLHVQKLEAAKYVGDFNVELFVDKQDIKANESVNATLKISGNGNFDDFTDVNLVTKANVFADKPVIKTQVIKDKLEGNFEKKFSLSANKDFVIEPFVLTYMSKKEGVLKTIKTKSFEIKVANTNEEKNLFVSSASTKEPQIVIQEEKDYLLVIWGFIGGFLSSVLLWFVYKYKKMFVFSKNQSEKQMLKKLYKIENEKSKEYMREIEEYLYGKSDTLRKKEIRAFIKSYEG